VVIDGDNTHSLVITNTTVTKENLEGVTSNYYEVLVGANCAYQVPEGIEVAVRNVYNETDGLYYIGLEGAVKADAKLKLLGNVKLNAPVTIGKDVIVNVATDIQYLGYKWVESLFPESKFHVIKCADSHIDGELVCLRPGTFLLNPKFIEIKEMLPEKFKKWNFIIPEDLTEQLDVKGMTDIDIQLASSRGMDINVLSLDENTVVVNKKAIGVKKALEENGFDIIEVELDNGEIFAGGIHCSTLDLVREDDYVEYE
jgi:hypothetical protein